MSARKIRFLLPFLTLVTLYCFSAGQQGKAVVDYSANLSNIKKKGEYVELIGDVVFYHNGVFITCDTAYRYSEQRMEGIGNVIINSDSTFIYGDKFVYNGETNIAKVYAPLIKTVDKDVVMFTHNLEFNTLLNTATYSGGGTTTQKENKMESQKGVYNADLRRVLLTGGVEMENEKYKIASDSVRYDFDTEVVTFIAKSNIWNHDGQFLVAQKGTYNTKSEIYDFYKNGYLLTKEQELWSDSMVYKSLDRSAKLYNNIQILDTTQRVISLGDQGYYWGNEKRVLITKSPAVVTYPMEGNDTSFMRADTILIIPMLDPMAKDSLVVETGSISEQIKNMLADTLIKQDTIVAPDSLMSDTTITDSLLVDTTTLIEAPDTTIEAEKVGWFRSLINRFKERQATKKEERLKNNILKVAERKRKIAERDSLRIVKLKMIAESDKYDLSHGRKVRGHRHLHEELDEYLRKDSLAKAKIVADSMAVVDSLAVADSLALADSLAALVVVDTLKADSSDYFIYGLRDVKSFMNSAQMVCDSMVVNSLDSTSTLFIKPLLWNEGNQISADSLKFFTKNNSPYKADLYEFPILGQSLRNNKFNQIKGKNMEAYFKNSEIDVLYVDGNSECVYYRSEEDGYISALINVTSANMEIYFDSSAISDLKWFNDIKFEVYPIEKLSENSQEVVEGFEWRPELRPRDRFDITTRSIRGSKRDDYSKIPQPQFKISESIDKEKIKFKKSGIWSDRNEPLPVDKNEFFQRKY